MQQQQQQGYYQAQPPASTVVIVQQNSSDEKGGDPCCAGATGFLLSTFLSPIFALCGLCCFKTDRARSFLFLFAALGTVLAVIYCFIIFSVYNNAANAWTGVSDISTKTYVYTDSANVQHLCTYTSSSTRSYGCRYFLTIRLLL